MDRTAIIIIIFAVCFFVLMYFFLNKGIKKNYREDTDEYTFIVKVPKGGIIFCWSICLVLLILIAIAVFAIKDEETEVFVYFVSAFLIVYIPLLIIGGRCKVVVNGNEIIYTPPIGREKVFNFSDITKVVFVRSSTRVPIGNGAIIRLPAYSEIYIYINDKKAFFIKLAMLNAHKFIERIVQNNINIVDYKGNAIRLMERDYLVH